MSQCVISVSRLSTHCTGGDNWDPDHGGAKSEPAKHHRDSMLRPHSASTSMMSRPDEFAITQPLPVACSGTIEPGWSHV